MKCRVCSSELRVGAKRCPNCGAEVSATGKMVSDVFKWNVQDFPKPKKKTDVTIDWTEGKIVNKQSGRVYKQSANMWSEPEEVKNLFTFEKKNEDFQEVLDKQMETIEAVAPETKVEEPMVFDLPSSMDMGLFEDLISDDVEILLPEKDSKSPVIEFKVAEAKDPETEDSTKEGSPISQETVSMTELPVDEETKEAKEEKPIKIKPEDEVVFSGIKKLMDAEEKFKQDMERVTYLTPAEAEKAEKIEDNSNKLRFVPTFSFRSLEDEYEAFCIENEKNSSEQNKEVNIEINEPSGTKVTVKTQEINIAKSPDSDGFKTQEVQMDSLKQGPKNVQVSVEVNTAGGNASVEVTRKHDGSTVVKTIDDSNASMAVQTEETEELLEATDENMSVEEIIEGQDETEAKETVETDETVEGEKIETSESPAVEDDSETESEEISDGKETEEKASEEESVSEEDAEDNQKAETEEFWKNSDTSNTSATRMTITDIFGPDARRILEGDDTEADEDIKNSLILDIKPEDIAVTEEQSAAIGIPTTEENSKENPAEAKETTDVGDDVAEADGIATAETYEYVASTTDSHASMLADETVTKEPTESAEDIYKEAVSEETTSVEAASVENSGAENASADTVGNEVEKKSGFGIVAKVFIAILVIILIAEFSVIGIKLFAPDSQAALFVERVQDSVVSVVSNVIGDETDGDVQQDADADLQDSSQQDANQQLGDDSQQTDSSAGQTPASGEPQTAPAQ